jgi:hypothetical protein
VVEFLEGTGNCIGHLDTFNVERNLCPRFAFSLTKALFHIEEKFEL